MKLSQKQIHHIASELDIGNVCYIHKETGEVKDMLTEETAEIGGVEEEWRKEMEVIEKEEDKWVLIEAMMSRDAFRIMENFAEQVGNRQLKNRLIQSLNGRRPFANFKNTIDYSDVRDDWFKFKQKQYEAWVRREIRGDFEFEEENEGVDRATVGAAGMTETDMNKIIANEIIVDAREEEVAMCWFYYMQDELEFPFEAEMEVKNRRGEKSIIQVDVLSLPKSNETSDSPQVILEVSEVGNDRVMDIGISKLQNVKGSEATQNAVAIWKHWESGKFQFV